MPIGGIDASQRKAARIAGFTYLLGIAIVLLANYGVNFRLIVPGNAVDTARNILAHETLFRLNIACNLLYVATILVLLTSVYIVLEPMSRPLAMVATCSRLVVAVMWAVTALSTLGALRLLGDAGYLSAFKGDQLQAMARLHLSASYDAYYVGLPFWGLSSTVYSYLWYRSRFIPRGLALFGLVASAWCVCCAFGFIALPHFDRVVSASWFDSPLLLFEMALGLRLLFRGVTPRSGEG